MRAALGDLHSEQIDEHALESVRTNVMARIAPPRFAVLKYAAAILLMLGAGWIASGPLRTPLQELTLSVPIAQPPSVLTEPRPQGSGNVHPNLRRVSRKRRANPEPE